MDEVSSKGELSNHTVLVFTHGDTFHPEIQSHDAKIQKFKEHMMSEEGIIKRLLEKVGGRFILVNNMEISKLKRLREAAFIIEQIDNLMVKATNVTVQDEPTISQVPGRSRLSLLGYCIPGFPACFPQNAEVVSHTNGSILMKDIQIGEQLMSVSSNGEITYSPVFLFGHANSNVTSEFINIITRQVSIKLSPDHHIYTKYDNQIVTVPSRQITRGNVIFRLDSNNNRLVEDEVTDICFCIEKGLYAPFTMSGTLVVEGVLASCYVDCVPPNWAHPLLWPVRLMYRMSPSFLAWISKPQTDGIPNWIHWIMETLIKKKLH
ncbi:sonic hedgehog protein-like [Haliotis rufescens]|uniref:sonic hedgehog protein-like n=1 Tax=Haliotis rufescens TaxID=6454 RepID=UPI00201EC683|nr:sonic hedgehog protein-like [Haliotis rufescens]